MKTTHYIRFHGFYESLHSELIDDAIQQAYTDGMGNELDVPFESIDYRSIYIAYSKEWLGKLIEWISDEYNLSLQVEFLSLSSPRFYNFEADKIEVELFDQGSLIKAFMLNDEFHTFLKDRTKSRDGYFSYFTYEDALLNEDNVLPDYIFEWLANQFEDEYRKGNYEILVNEVIDEYLPSITI